MSRAPCFTWRYWHIFVLPQWQRNRCRKYVEAVYSPVSMRAALSPTSKRLRFIAVMVASLVMAVLLNLLTFGYMLLLKMPVMILT